MTEPELIMRKGPPPSVGRKLSARYADALETMRADPGEWYAMLDYGTNFIAGITAAGNARGSLMRQCTGYEFQTAAAVLYGRYVGPARP